MATTVTPPSVIKVQVGSQQAPTVTTLQSTMSIKGASDFVLGTPQDGDVIAYHTSNGNFTLVAPGTGGTMYTNANVAAYLPNYGGTVNAAALFYNGDYINIASDVGFQLQYDPSQTYNPYDLKNGSWIYFDATGLTWQSNVTGQSAKTIYFDNAGNLTASGNVGAQTILVNGSPDFEPRILFPNGQSILGRQYDVNYSNTNYVSITANTLHDFNGLSVQEGPSAQAQIYTEGYILFTANSSGSAPDWRFDTQGNLIFPDSTSQNTAFTGYATDNTATTIARAAYVQANTANTVAIASYVQANTATIIGQAAYVQANTANTVAIASYVQANTATTIGQAAYEQANTATIIGQAAYVQANTATTIGQAAYVQANTATTIGQAAYNRANSEIIGTAAYVQANTATTIGQAAYGQANTATTIGQAAYDQANTATTIGQAAYVQANTATTIGQASYSQVNTTQTFVQSAYDTANTKFNSAGGTISGNVVIQNNLTVNGNLNILGTSTTINTSSIVLNDPLIYLAANNYTSDVVDIGLIAHYNDGISAHTGIFRDPIRKEWIFFKGYVPEVQSNNIINIADPTFAYSNVYASVFKGNLSGYVTFTDGTTQTTAASPSVYSVAAYGQANTATIIGQAAYVQANTATTIGQAAYVQANTATTIGQAAYVQANTATIIGQAAFARANSEIIGTAAYVQANTATTIGEAAYVQANTATIIAQAAYVQANTSNTVAIAAYVQANTATTIGQAAFSRANSEIIGTAAYVQANTATTIGQAAYVQANTATIIGQAAYVQANTANTVAIAAYVQANTATIIGQAAYSTANLKFDTAGGTITGSTTINANLIVTGANVSLGNVGNVHIYGGNTGQLLITDGQGNINWTDLPTPNTVTYTANSLIQTNGVYVSGNLWSTQVFGDYLSSNGVYVLTDGTGTAPAWYIDFDFINVVKFNRVVMNINYTQNSGHTIYVQLYNNLTSAWDNIGTYSGLGSYYAFALEVIDEADYLSGGIVRLRLYHSNQGSASHQTSIDYVALEQSIQGPQGPRGPTGATGATGATGNGVPTGGTTGQVLIKNSSTNYDTVWSDNLITAWNTGNAAFIQANTATTIAQAAYNQANTGAGSTFTQSAYDQANTATIIAQAAYAQANTGGGGTGAINIAVDSFTATGSSAVFTLSNDPLSINNIIVNLNGVTQLKSSYTVVGTTLTLSEIPVAGTLVDVTIFLTASGGGASGVDQTARTTANNANTVAISAYNQANTATIIAEAAYAQANTGGSGVDQTARTTANTATIIGQAAYVQANTANTVAIDSYVQANTATIIGQAAYGQANTATIIGQAAFVQANTANTVAIASYVQANTATIIGQAAYVQANTATTIGQAAYVQANTANTVAIASYVQANTATIIGQAAYGQSNTATIIGQAAFVQANTANTVAIASYIQANTATIIAQAAYGRANSEIIGTAAYVQANTATIIGQAAFVQANTANTVAIASYVQANTATIIGQAAYGQANTATIIGQAAYDRANSEIIGTAAYVQANTATIIAQAAYAQANTGGASANSFATILVSGQSDVIANTATGRLTFVAGSGMTITTSQTSNTITFASSGGFSGGTITNQLIVANSTPSISNGTGALIVQGGVGVSGNVYIGASGVLGFANNASVSVVYQVYNPTTNSLDTIFN